MEWWEYLIVIVVWVCIWFGFWAYQTGEEQKIGVYEKEQLFLKQIHKLLIVCLLLLMLISYKLFLT
jgi:hypothetical protein